MTKKELAQSYKISSGTLRKLLNVRYFEELQKVGYKKTDQILSPAVVRKFWELYDKPIQDDEIYAT